MPHDKDPRGELLLEQPGEGVLEKQLKELREDQDFKNILAQLTKRIMRSWGLSYTDAASHVLSAVGEPSACVRIYDALKALVAARESGNPQQKRRARCELAVICRRRVIDLMRKDARRPDHFSFPTSNDQADQLEPSFLDATVHVDARDEFHRQELSRMVQKAVDCFGRQGDNEERQAELLRRRQLEGQDYTILSAEFACSQGALRVRLHAAMRAFYRHIERCHPELIALRQPTLRKRNKA